jgi:pyrophosphatase PpaX
VGGVTRPAGPRAVLFDLDGTLLDSAELIIAAFQETCRHLLGRDVDRDAILREWARPIRDRFRALAPECAETLSQDYLRRYLALHDRYARLFPGVAETLDTLHARGYAMAIVTSKRRATTQAALDAFHLDRWCGVVIADEDVARHKPDPEPVLSACARLGVPPRDAIMVGDTPFDIGSGRRAGASTAGAFWGTVDAEALRTQQPDYELPAPTAVLSLCPPR